MQFRVPKYLERESTIAFGLTFKKLAILGGMGLLLFFLYYIVPKILFIFLAIVCAGGFFVFTFVKVRGRSLFEMASHSFRFFFSSRTYLWQKKRSFKPISVVKKKKKDTQKKAPLKISPQSRLSDIRAKIDLGP